jgi:hypothetical protein
MNHDIQGRLFAIIKNKLEGKDNMGLVLGDLLNLSPDAIYRRSRNETPLTITELEKICSHYHISFDALMGNTPHSVIFNYRPLSEFDFSLESYLISMQQAFHQLQNCSNPRIQLTSNNLPIFQLLNFPRLSRFRLYFWAKTHLHIDEYKNQKYKDERVTEAAFKIGAEILNAYVNIPTEECYDSEFLRGFMRQILYYSEARLFEDPEHALKLIDDVKNLADHIREQIISGYKIKYRDNPENTGNTFEVCLNDTINTDNTFYYSSDKLEGIYISHNMLNFLHTTDPQYVQESKAILQKQFANSSIISRVNEKQRNDFFHKLYRDIEHTQKQILAAISAS